MTVDDLAVGLADAARRAGAREALAVVERIVSCVSTRRSGERPQRESATLDVPLLRVWSADGREGVARGPIDGLVERAMAALADQPHGALPEFRRPAMTGHLIEDRRWASLDDPARDELLEEMASPVNDVSDDVVLQSIRFEDACATRALARPGSAALVEVSTRFSATADVVDVTRSRKLTASVRSRALSSVVAMPFAGFAARRLAALASPGPALPSHVRTILTPLATASLVAALAPCFLPGAKSFLDDAALDARLLLLDDGSLPGGLFTRSVDDRGQPTGPITLLRDGRLDRRILHAREQAAAGLPGVGHDVQGTPATSNLAMGAGLRTMNAILMEKRLASVSIDDWLSLEVDFATGVARGVAHVAVLQGNAVLGHLPDVKVTMALVDVLSHVADIAVDTDRVGHIDAPALWLEGVRFAV